MILLEVLKFAVISVAPLSCTMTKKCTIISQIIPILRVSILLCHPQGACNQYHAKLQVTTWQGIDYKLPEEDTIVSKHVGVG